MDMVISPIAPPSSSSVLDTSSNIVVDEFVRIRSTRDELSGP